SSAYLFSEFYLLAACAALLAAPRRPWPLAVGAFWLSFPVAELPFLALAWSTATTLAVLLTAPAGGAFAVTALVASALVTAQLAVVIAEAARTPAIVTRALTYAGLPSRARIRPSWSRAVFAPFASRGRRVERGVSYGPDPAHLLDVYPPANGGPGDAVLVYLHGGSYSGGRRSREALPLLRLLARRGWTCVSADYRLRPAAGLAEHLADAERVLEWVRRHHAGAPVFLAGSSAGAHLAVLTALRRGGRGFPVAGVVCLYGFFGRYFGDAAGFGGPTSPLECDLEGAPPFFIAHGSRDTVVPVAEARRFAAALRRESRRPVVLAELTGAQHGFDVFHSARFGAVAEGIAQFLARLAELRSDRFDDRKV
ncbi:MAG TPA: alpha/beta hydrolase, partial [Phytomonospora sp.]